MEQPQDYSEGPARPVDVLLVEDSPHDVFLLKQVLRETGSNNLLHVVEDGAKAIRFLRREPPYADAPRPDLILLDLNLPRLGGHELLREIKADPLLKRIPVVILTTSLAEEDVFRSYDLQATSFIAKSVDLDEFIEAVRAIEHYWLRIVSLPSKPAAA